MDLRQLLYHDFVHIEKEEYDRLVHRTGMLLKHLFVICSHTFGILKLMRWNQLKPTLYYFQKSVHYSFHLLTEICKPL